MFRTTVALTTTAMLDSATTSTTSRGETLSSWEWWMILLTSLGGVLVLTQIIFIFYIIRQKRQVKYEGPYFNLSIYGINLIYY